MDENNLSQALAENGSFDAAKAAGLKQLAMKSFDSALKKVLWQLFAYLLLWVVVGLFAYHMLQARTDTKSLIIYGIVLLVAYESTVLMKLWFWIVNAKLSVLKELKLMRLQMPAASGDTGAWLEGEGATDVSPFQRTFSRKLRWGWTLLFVIAVFFVNGPLQMIAYRDAGALQSKGYVTVQEDGTASFVTEMSHAHGGAMPLEELTFRTGDSTPIRWLDEQGRELRSESSATEHGYLHTASLAKPVIPGERLTYIRLAPGSATQSDGVWTFTMDWAYGHAINRFTETVKLPPHAEVLSVEPDPASRFTRGDRAPILHFEAERERNEAFGYKITYRIPAAS